MHFEIPDTIKVQGKYINQFELYAVLIAVREWKEQIKNLNVLLYCDNQTTVQVLQSGKVSCPFMQKCLREIRFHSAKFNFRVRAVYLNTSDNTLADCLSRWHLASNYSKNIFRSNKESKLNRNNSFKLRNRRNLVISDSTGVVRSPLEALELAQKMDSEDSTKNSMPISMDTPPAEAATGPSLPTVCSSAGGEIHKREMQPVPPTP